MPTTNAAPVSGSSKTVNMGNGCLVRCARIIFVVMRPNTSERMAQSRGTRLCERIEECGEPIQIMQEAVKMRIGVHSMMVGRKGRF